MTEHTMVRATSDGCDRETEDESGICPECKDSTAYQWVCTDCDFVSETRTDTCPSRVALAAPEGTP